MKRLIILLVLIANVCTSDISDESDDTKVFKGLGFIVNMKIKALIKELKAGTPSYDPFVMEAMPIKFEQDEIKLDLTTTGNVIGVLGLTVKDLIMVGTPCPTGDPDGCITLNYKVVIPEINVDITEYILDASINMLNIFGKGKLMLNIKDLTLEGTDGVIRNDNLKFSLEKMDIKISIGDFAFKITGFANDEVISDRLSKTVTEIVPTALAVFKVEISSVLNKLIMQLTKGKFIQI